MGIKVWVDMPTPALCFTANTAGSTVQLSRGTSTSWSPYTVSLETSTDYQTWTNYSIDGKITLTNVWDKVWFRNKSETTTEFSHTNWYWKFVMTWSIAWSWDVTYLLNKNWTKTLSGLTQGCLYGLFYWCTSLTTAPELPATTLSTHCYDNMFSWCTNLITAPELPATTLATYCYRYMFYWCTSLTTVPNLPATTLASNCYSRMFRWCTSLTTAPSLSATKLASYCCENMFAYCNSLTILPELPVTTLVDYCYQSMFAYCTSLTALPSLPATTLASNCYRTMFYWCSNIKLSTEKTWEYQTEYRIPITWEWITATDSLYYMFYDTWWTFKWTPSINTTYYTSNTVV